MQVLLIPVFMKTPKLFALVGIFLTLLQSLPTQTYAQLTDTYQNYVVIGAFRYHRNAVRLTNLSSKDLNKTAKYEMNPNRGLYYVYVLNTADRQEAINEALRLRDESQFKDTWVFSGPLGKQKPETPSYTGVDINPVSQTTIAQVSDGNENNTGSTEEAQGKNEPAALTTVNSPAPAPENTVEVDDGIEGKPFHFKLFRNGDNKIVEGEVDIIDQEKLRKVGSFKGNMNVKLAPPPGKTKNIAAVCEVFGYRKLQRDFNYDNPSGDGITTNDGAVTVPFELVRLQKGDIAVMYNVYFFKDAAVMRPESRFEVNSLLEMLNENPKYKIKIHGHTNGKAAGKIIFIEPGSDDFFSLNNTTEGAGSAKKLSQERAMVIRNFLISNGVAEDRMETKAWGGKKPIHDKHHTRAQENVRVEIEILED
jgi:outer membrane protein OmpA-like peptidoglycan-associated protein